ncbi:2-oxoglutarate dehydrogenase E1 component [Luteibacter sp. UNCMF331Sha3.1]|uniref:2-oxoglutarate dehydrogenase E1 component n=1 Tax=Luteibacter sp. UNCMF331Sha3.1 TaxID=1502760 RepID=UPI0008CA717C|nr:2-oxoglutarate dehydrogenase E1 component [Luteibacter sp. UNCMF331Sha3.1]SEM53605.1 2-oxoglutarate dehydrogenase E1 component [Luteibacter sp. UNCMF331Sha3.1]
MNAVPRATPLRHFFSQTSYLDAGNATYIEDLAQRYERDPASLPPEWRNALGNIPPGPAPTTPQRAPVASPDGTGAVKDAVRAQAMIQAFRTRGHFGAQLDPLGLKAPLPHAGLDPAEHGFANADLDRSVFVDGAFGRESMTLRELEGALRQRYTGSIGYEYMHIVDPARREWLRQRIEHAEPPGALARDEKLALLKKLVEVKGFERYLDKKFVGTTRFGADGAEATIPALEAIVQMAARHGVTDIVIGMAHRTRLNVMSQVLNKPHRAIFSEFRGGSFIPEGIEGSGDVKYHAGVSADREIDGRTMHLSMAANPSHLEVVDPVVLGNVRAKQDRNGDSVARSTVLPLLIHGDAAFAGQGVVAEMFGLSGLEGHRTGGSVHFIINNQIGFTTNPVDSRSTAHPSDLARMVDAPIFHVNGDDPEAVIAVSRLAFEYRQTFGMPAVVDMVCFRFYGHNEGDEPAFTQPAMYAAIRAHPSTLEIYVERLRGEGIVTDKDVDTMKAEWVAHLDAEFEASDAYRPERADWLEGRWKGIRSTQDPKADTIGDTAARSDALVDVGSTLTRVPDGFQVHPTVRRFLDARRKTLDEREGIDWSTAEALALGTLLAEGTRVRLVGQDSERGTFTQRHAAITDQATGARHVSLGAVAAGQAPFEVINSMLSEEAVLAYEYGYSTADPHALVLWEAQFGDFANGAQVVFDQFLASGERKWLRMSGLTCLLPHGFDGQGPEHSSARLERFLQNSAEDNWQVANCTTPANYFHILRRQVRRDIRKPLILMTPKSLLRHRRAKSMLDEMGPGTAFQPVLRDDADTTGRTPGLLPDAGIRRVLIGSGKVYYDLLDQREKLGLQDVYLLRVEELYPFPARRIAEEMARFANAEWVWCQEEPENMGAWTYMAPRLRDLQRELGVTEGVRYIGRAAAASPAVGSSTRHKEQTLALLTEAFA